MLVTDDGIARLANEVHPLKARCPMLATEDGIATLVNELHPSKTPFPMLVTDDGIARLANELHPKKAQSPILVTEDGMVTCVTFVLSTPHSFQESSPFPHTFSPLMVVVPSGMAKCIPPWPSDGSAAAAASAAAAILGCPDVAT